MNGNEAQVENMRALEDHPSVNLSAETHDNSNTTEPNRKKENNCKRNHTQYRMKAGL